MSTNARDDQVRAVLLEAAKLVERGWCQGMEKRGVQRCMYRALIDANEHSCYSVTQKASEAVRALIKAYSILDWNDAPERTQAEVVAALRGAAEGMGKERAE